MAGYRVPIRPAGRPVEPLDVVLAMRWMGDLTPDEIVTAIRRAADTDIAARWPELSSGEIDEMRALCAAMSKSRLQAWKTHDNPRAPTWLEVRALLMGLTQVFE